MGRIRNAILDRQYELEEEAYELRKQLAEKEALIQQQKRKRIETDPQSWEYNFNTLKELYVGHVINLRNIESTYSKPVPGQNRWDNLLLWGGPEENEEFNKKQKQSQLDQQKKQQEQDEKKKHYVNEYKSLNNFNHNEAVFNCLQRLDERISHIEENYL